jgi:hypothetical protein
MTPMLRATLQRFTLSSREREHISRAPPALNGDFDGHR